MGRRPSGRARRARIRRRRRQDIRLAWDDNIDPTYVTDAYGRTTEYYFDDKGYNYRIVYPDHKEEWFDYDAQKNLVNHIFPDGSQDSFTYDDKGNMVLHERRDGSEVALPTTPRTIWWKSPIRSAKNGCAPTTTRAS